MTIVAVSAALFNHNMARRHGVARVSSFGAESSTVL
jgi:hypothetical protein